MMDRRSFLRRVGLVAAGVVAADQLDVLDRLGWKRRFFPGWSPPSVTLPESPDVRGGLTLGERFRLANAHGQQWEFTMEPNSDAAAILRTGFDSGAFHVLDVGGKRYRGVQVVAWERYLSGDQSVLGFRRYGYQPSKYDATVSFGDIDLLTP